MLNDLFPF